MRRMNSRVTSTGAASGEAMPRSLRNASSAMRAEWPADFFAQASKSPRAGGVLNFVDCRDTAIQDCSLYGCGVLGVTAYTCKDLSIRYTEIHHCSYGAFSMQNCVNVSAERCNIHDIPGYIWYTYGCRNVTQDGEPVPEGNVY